MRRRSGWLVPSACAALLALFVPRAGAAEAASTAEPSTAEPPTAELPAAASPAKDGETVLRAASALERFRSGDPIRVTLRTDESRTGRFANVTGSDLLLRHGAQERHIPLSSIQSIQRRAGSHGHFLTGALLGLVAGAGIGALISTSEESGTTQWVATTIYTLAGAGGGLVLGGVAGSLIRSDRWESVYER